MNRRHFLSVLGAGAAGFALDPERLLWRPGQRTFFLPTPTPAPLLSVGDLVVFKDSATYYFSGGNAYVVARNVERVTGTSCGPIGFLAHRDGESCIVQMSGLCNVRLA